MYGGGRAGVCAGAVTLWCRCFGSGRWLRPVLVRGGAFVSGGAGRRLTGRVGSEGEPGYRGERGERSRTEQDVVEPASGAGAGGVGDGGAGLGRDQGRYPGTGAGGYSGSQSLDGAEWRW